MTLKNDRFIKALFRQPVDCTPIWIMRQAGRYLPEYQALRAQVPNFMEFCKKPELACEVTLQPLARFDLDAAIIFSDILVIPDALGVPVRFDKGHGPVLEQPIRTLQDVERLNTVEALPKLNYVTQAIQLVTRELNQRIPLIGFAGSPWTVACYMVEGGGSKTFSTIKKMAYAAPEVLHALLHKLAMVTIDYLNAQIAAGASAIMLFDTWGGILSRELYQQFSLNYLKQIAAHLNRHLPNRKIPVIFFTKNGGQWLELMADAGCDALGLDWTTNLADAKQRVGDKVALQGNLDPAVLFTNPDIVRQEALKVLNAYGDAPGHVFNLGHGIEPHALIDNVKALVDTVHTMSVRRG